MVFLYLAFRNVDFQKLGDVFKQINYWWTIPFVIITMVSMYFRAIRWRWILKARYDFTSWRLFPSLIIGFALNSLLPLRAGEFARPYVLAKKEKIPYSTILATVVVERIIDGITLLFSFMIVLLFVTIDPTIEIPSPVGDYIITGELLDKLSQKFAFMIFVLLIGSITLIFERTRKLYEEIIKRLPLLGTNLKEKLIGLLEKFSHGFHSLKNAKYVTIIFIHSLIVWCLVGFSLQVMSWGFPELELNFLHGMAVMIIICVAILIPAAPGYWGLYECGGKFALMALGLVTLDDKGGATALGFSLVIHALQILPIVLVGIFFLWRENISLGQVERLAKANESPPNTEATS